MDVAASFAAWLAALNAPRTRAPLEAAVAADARIERHGWVPRDGEPDRPAEILDGFDAIERWLYRLPPRVTFTAVGAPVAVADGWKLEYALEVAGFHGGGHWLARFAADGRLAHLSHRPFPLPPELGGPGPDERAAGSGPSAPTTAHADHDHDHHHR